MRLWQKHYAVAWKNTALRLQQKKEYISLGKSILIKFFTQENKDFKEEELKRQLIHPANNKKYFLEEMIGLYAWHCNHHLAHIEQALVNKGKFN